MTLIIAKPEKPHHITPKVEENVIKINAKISDDVPVYKGAYTVEPLIYQSTVLETKQKVMAEDVVVNKITVRKVKNATGGYTLYVAESED